MLGFECINAIMDDGGTTSRYVGLQRAQLSYDYLHTNSTTHEFLFGALAEILDNSRDASATKIDVYTVPNKHLRGGFMLCFLDDGRGMDRDEASDVITFGKSLKRSNDSTQIGMYGNGLKSGSMRIGNDLIVFTKKGPVMTCVFLSRTFHEDENIDEIIVPMPAFDAITKKPIAKTKAEVEKHEIEMNIIYKYSPFKTNQAFFAEFDKITEKAGSLITIYNLKLLDSGEPELDPQDDDIVLRSAEQEPEDSDDSGHSFYKMMPERKSLRAYVAILYVDPWARIYIQGKKVRTKRLAACLLKPRCYNYNSTRFKTRSERDLRKAQDESKAAENRAREAESKAKSLEARQASNASREQRAQLRKLQNAAALLRAEHEQKKNTVDRKKKSIREPKTLKFIFGMNINNRNQDGMFIYNCSRLIKMYQKVGPQADSGTFCAGVVGIVDVPYLVLEPTHNKQEFADGKEYSHLQKAMGEHMVQYWKDIGIAQMGISRFWEDFGYTSLNWKDPPSSETKYIKKRAMQINQTIQCDLCLKWRTLPFSANQIGKAYPDNWTCQENTDPKHNRCSTDEAKAVYPEGVLRKEVKTKEQRLEELDDQIRRKQLERDQTARLVTSTREDKEARQAEQRQREKEDKQREQRRREERKKAEEQERKRAEERERAAAKKSSYYNAKDAVRISDRNRSQTTRYTSQYVPPAPRRRSHPTPTRRAVVSSDDDDDDGPPAKRPAQSPPSKTSVPTKAPATSSKQPAARRGALDATIYTEKSDEESKEETSDQEILDKHIGTRVEARTDGQWHTGKVVAVNKSGKWKVKFDENLYDKWYVKTGEDIRIVTPEENGTDKEKTGSEVLEPANNVPQSTVQTPPSSDTAAEDAPTSSTATASYEEVANGYRTCLRYFLPPQWTMNKDQVSTLSVDSLASFPLDDFFDHYEKGLRKLVSGFQQDALKKQQKATEVTEKLNSVRRMIAKLLKSINPEFDIDPETDPDDVDALLEACVKQALENH